jgi:hypothetical protein
MEQKRIFPHIKGTVGRRKKKRSAAMVVARLLSVCSAVGSSVARGWQGETLTERERDLPPLAIAK